MIRIKNAELATLARYVGRPLAFLLILDVAVVAAYVFGGWKWLSLPDVPLSILGAVIGLIAGFRNTSAYARWWEARKIWGSVVNGSRNFAREALTMIAAPETCFVSRRELSETRRNLVMLQIGYVHALRHHLRGTVPWPDLAGLIPEAEIETLRGQADVPLAIQQNMAELIAGCYRQGAIDDVRWVSLNKTLSALMDCQGASERIKNTPMPQLYDVFIRVFVDAYCLLLPFGMVASLGLWTPLGSTLVGFIFLTLDKIGRDLEAPYENAPHGLLLTAITQTIEADLRQMIAQETREPIVR